MSEEKCDFRPLRVRLTLKTDYIFYPIDSEEFIKKLSQYDYEITGQSQSLGPLRLEMSGQLAKKRENLVILDTNRQILGIEGKDPEIVVDDFNQLENIIQKDMKINYLKSIKFYETIIDYHIFVENNPREMIEDLYKEDELTDIFSSIIDKDVSPYTIRYASAGITPDSPEWIDFKIEPFVRRANNVYAFNLVYRSTDGNQVKEKIVSIKDIMRNIVETIENKNS
jgi:hypothetical protein